MRTSRKQAQSSFERLINAIGGRVATSYKDVGAYSLDYAACYGGFRIERIINDGGGVTCPFGDTRMTPSELVDAVHFTLRALEVQRNVAMAA